MFSALTKLLFYDMGNIGSIYTSKTKNSLILAVEVQGLILFVFRLDVKSPGKTVFRGVYLQTNDLEGDSVRRYLCGLSWVEPRLETGEVI